MATSEELERFLQKRGYEVTVKKHGDISIIYLSRGNPDNLAQLFADIPEPGKIIILSADITDPRFQSVLTERIDEVEKYTKSLKVEIALLRLSHKEDYQNLNLYQEEVERKLARKNEEILNILKEVKSKPWWRKW